MQKKLRDVGDGLSRAKKEKPPPVGDMGNRVYGLLSYSIRPYSANCPLWDTLKNYFFIWVIFKLSFAFSKTQSMIACID